MNDNIPNTPEQSPTTATQRPLLIMGGIGCALLLLVGFLMGGGWLILRANATADPPAAEQAASSQGVAASPNAATAANTPPAKRADTLNLASNYESTQASDTLGSSLSAATDVPQIGRITFAPATTAAGQPVDPGFMFDATLTEIHAVFEYAGMSADDTWTQVWYHNGDELLSTTQPWIKGQEGTFDYSIKAGDEPFTPGEWTLELYVGDELLSAGSFVIEGEAE